MPQTRRLNVQDCGSVISMLQTGMSSNAVSRLMNRSQSVIDRLHGEGFRKDLKVEHCALRPPSNSATSTSSTVNPI